MDQWIYGSPLPDLPPRLAATRYLVWLAMWHWVYCREKKPRHHKHRMSARPLARAVRSGYAMRCIRLDIESALSILEMCWFMYGACYVWWDGDRSSFLTWSTATGEQRKVSLKPSTCVYRSQTRPLDLTPVSEYYCIAEVRVQWALTQTLAVW